MINTTQKLKAKALFIEEGRTIQEISTITGINVKTLYRYATQENWKQEQETIALTSSGAYKQTLKIAIDKLKEMAASGKVDPRDADAISKIVRSVKSLYKDVDSLGSILMMITELTEYLQETAPDALHNLVPHLDGFRQVMSKKYGKKN